MASIERTAYPRFKRNPLAMELDTLYAPTEDELNFANAVSRKESSRFSILLLLKAFQRLGYFPNVENIPPAIVQHIRTASGVNHEISPVYTELKTLYRHHQIIRQYLNVVAWNDDGLRVASEAMSTAAEVMDNPADLINVAIEELVRNRIELPAFSTLDRHSRRIRTLVNSRIFAIPKTESVIPQPAAAPENVPTDSKPAVYVAQQINEFIEYLLKTYRPRLSITAYSPDLGVMGAIEFYDNFEVVETYTVKELHSLNVSLLRRPTVWILSMPVKHSLFLPGRFLTTSNRQTNSPTIRQN